MCPSDTGIYYKSSAKNLPKNNIRAKTMTPSSKSQTGLGDCILGEGTTRIMSRVWTNKQKARMAASMHGGEGGLRIRCLQPLYTMVILLTKQRLLPAQ